ncbi:MAG: hypothetical protein GY820_31775, partial [Gammaproteobacteria bacterium]|nr:hypothetical protein [Gammaproteobacteria bacterium]
MSASAELRRPDLLPALAGRNHATRQRRPSGQTTQRASRATRQRRPSGQTTQRASRATRQRCPTCKLRCA